MLLSYKWDGWMDRRSLFGVTLRASLCDANNIRIVPSGNNIRIIRSGKYTVMEEKTKEYSTRMQLHIKDFQVKKHRQKDKKKTKDKRQ